MWRVSGSGGDNTVRVTLECSSRPYKRILTITPGHPIAIGRASKNSSKKIEPAETNAFFDCAVMSRSHAKLFLANVSGSIMIADAGSLHGTFLNNTKLTCDSLLRIGDKIKFGDSVSRSSSVHDGVQVSCVAIETIGTTSHHVKSASASYAKTNTFKVPSDDEDDGDHPDDTIVQDEATPQAKDASTAQLKHHATASNADMEASAFDAFLTEPDLANTRPSDEYDSDSAELDSEDDFGDDWARDFEQDDQDDGPSCSDDISPVADEAVDAEPPEAPEALISTATGTQVEAADSFSTAPAPLATESASLFPNYRTLPIPEKLKLPGVVAHPSSVPPPAHTSKVHALLNDPKPTLTFQALPREPLHGHYATSYNSWSYGGDMDIREPSGYSEIAAEWNKPLGSEEFEQTPATFASMNEAPEGEALGAKLTTDNVGHEVVAGLSTSDRTDNASGSLSGKRKRAEMEADDSEEVEDGPPFVTLRHDSASGLTDLAEASQAASKSLLGTSCMPCLSRGETSMAKPAKRVKTSSIHLALTAAVGAFGGCVATVGFLCSPLAERLLA